MPISRKQKRIMAFPYTDFDAIVCDGAIRSGKTVFMMLSFVDDAMRRYNNQRFGICGKTVDSTVKNLIMPYIGLTYAKDKYRLLSGKRGEGKSTFMSQMVADAIEQGNAVFIYSGELPNYHFKNWLDLQIAGSNHIEAVRNEFGDEEYFLTEHTVEAINKWYYDKAYIFDNSAVSDDEYEGLIKVMVDAICRYDIKLCCIDNLMTAMDGDPNTDIYRQQSQFVKKLERLAQQYDVAIILVAHPKKTNNAFDNDTVSGSADITNAVSFVFNYQRADEADNCDSLLMVTKNRMNGKLMTGDNAIPLYYSEKSKRISANPNEFKEYGCFRSAEKYDDLEWDIL